MSLVALSTPAWSGLSAVLGALVGGAVTGFATYRIEQRRQNFERQRDASEREAIARGTARVMRLRYNRVESVLATSLKQGIWPPMKIDFDRPMPLEDQKLVASLIGADEWAAVDQA